MCYVTRHGGTRAEIEKEYQKVCTDAPKRDRSAVAEAIAVAIANIEQNNNELDESFRQFQLINGLLQALSLSLGIIPGLGRIFRVAPAGLQRGIQFQMQKNQVQHAANDRTLTLLREAAANEARFLRTGTD